MEFFKRFTQEDVDWVKELIKANLESSGYRNVTFQPKNNGFAGFITYPFTMVVYVKASQAERHSLEQRLRDPLRNQSSWRVEVICED